MFKNKIYIATSVFLAAVSLIFLSATSAHADDLQIVFSTSTEQTIPIKTAGMIKINVVDSLTNNAAPGTIYLNPMTNGDGQFSSNKDNWVPITSLPLDSFPTSCTTGSLCISSSSPSRTFYYKGFSTGTYQITISAKSKNGIVLNNISQSIIISATDANDSQNATTSDDNTISDIDTEATSTATTTTITKIITKTVYISSHFSSEDLSNYDEKTAFEISAGRERTAIVGSPLEFDAKYTLIQKDQCTPDFKWSFGDGFEASGRTISHVYKYPGEYQIVLNGTCGVYNAVSRTTVKVVSPSISIISLENGDIEVSNKDKTEINLGMWKIKGGQKDFIFSKDTIVSASSSIILSKEDLGVSPTVERISLNNPSEREVAFIDNKILSQNIATSSQLISVGDTYISVAEAENLIKDYKKKNELQINKNIPIKNEVVTINTNIDSNNIDVSQTATVAEAVVSTTTKGFWANLIGIPIKGLKSFAHIFYDF